MRTMLLATAVILTVRTLVLATASSMVMATAGTVFAERASVALQRLAVAAPSPPPHPSDPAAQLAAATAPREVDWRDRMRLAQGWHPPAEASRKSTA